MSKKRGLAALLAALACVGCATTQIAGAGPNGQSKSLAWAQGCWNDEAHGFTLSLLPDRAQGGLLSGAITEIFGGRRAANQTLTFSRDGMQLALAFGDSQPTDAFWLSPYDEEDVFEAMRRVQVDSAIRSPGMPLYAVFQSELGLRLLLEGDGRRLTIRAESRERPAETYFSGGRMDCPQESFRPDDSDV